MNGTFNATADCRIGQESYEGKRMGRFYFHLKDAGKLLKDPEGEDLPDIDAARQEALLAARDLLSDAIRSGRTKIPEAFVIADEEGRKLDVVPLCAVLPESLKK